MTYISFMSGKLLGETAAIKALFELSWECKVNIQYCAHVEMSFKLLSAS